MYAPSDLGGLFAPLRDPSKRVGTAYFEFHPKELPAEFACWLPGSYFLKDAAFDFYAECFHKADPNFDYFNFQRYDVRGIQSICAELDNFVALLDSGSTSQVTFSGYASLFSPDIWRDIPVQLLHRFVREGASDLCAFIRTETSSSGCLWVLGM